MKLKKKATYTADTAPFYAIFAIVVTVLFMIFVLLVNHYSADNVEIPKNIEAYLLYQRFLRSPDCFTYEDISGRAYPLILDWSKFTEENLKNCYVSYQNKNIPAFRLKLTFPEKESTIQTENWNSQFGPHKIEKPKQMWVYFNNEKYKGELSIEIQNV